MRGEQQEIRAKMVANKVHNHTMAPDDDVCSYPVHRLLGLKPSALIVRN